MLRVVKQRPLSAIKAKNLSALIVGSVGAATASVLLHSDRSSILANPAFCSDQISAADQDEMSKQIDMYVDSIVGSKMSNIPGLPGPRPEFRWAIIRC